MHRLIASSNDSEITKRVKEDFNELDDNQFMMKYQCSRETYFDRVERYGDPYMNSPLAKLGKILNNINR